MDLTSDVPPRGDDEVPLATEQLVRRLRAAGCVFAEEEAGLLQAQARSSADLTRMVERREMGLPLEQVLGWAEFYGLRIAVQPGVFVPRRRTELLAHRAISMVARLGHPLVVDLCCGSGALAAAVLAVRPEAHVHASDIDPRAVRCAQGNLERAGARVHQGDLYEALPTSLRHRVDVVVVNAPYVPSEFIALMPPEARLHEPLEALDGGPDGLAWHRRVIAEAPPWLAPGGCLIVETSVKQAGRTVDLFSGAGFTAQVEHDEELDGTLVWGTPARQSTDTVR